MNKENNDKDERKLYQESDKDDSRNESDEELKKSEVENSIEKEMERGLNSPGDIERGSYKDEKQKKPDDATNPDDKHANDLGHTDDPHRGS